MLIQTSHATDRFHINIDIEMPRMPCDVIGLDIEDNLGYHVVDYYGEMTKTRIDRDGLLLEVETEADRSVARDRLYDRVKKELELQ
jgi:hypothetical protein